MGTSAKSASPQLVNLGCGTRYHRDWTNIDIVAAGPGVLAHDLRTGVPLPENSCDAVYHAHVLEHIPRTEAPGFIRECFRVLRPGGVFRVVVPDLEQICRLYLEKLEGAVAGDANAAQDYRWMMLELLDQTVRQESGGGMKAYLDQEQIPNREFVETRIGAEGRNLIDILRRNRSQAPAAGANVAGSSRKSPLGAPWRYLVGGIRRRLELSWYGPDLRSAYRIGQFRLSGEVHQWMYDRYSLAQLLTDCGFVGIGRRTALESDIPDWPRFELDADGEGAPYKPDSLYLEARKPA